MKKILTLTTAALALAAATTSSAFAVVAAGGTTAASFGSASLINGYGISTEIVSAGGAILGIALAILAFRKVKQIFGA